MAELSGGYRITVLKLATSLLAITAASQAHAQDQASAQVGPPSVAPAQTAEPTNSSPVAENADVGIADIIVTAQRRGENLQDVPIAITALGGETLAASGITVTNELPFVTPSLTVNSAIGYALPRIRGVGTAASGAGIENPVALYIDGVYIAAATAAMTSMPNLEQIAVLKGPQGTLFGRNATGGLIQVTTLSPSSTFGGKIDLGYGNLDTLYGNLYVTGGLADGVAADFAAYYNNQRDGFGVNTFNGREIGNSKDVVLRSKLRWDIGTGTRATLALDYASTDANQPAFRPTYGSLPVTGIPYTGRSRDVNTNTQPALRTRQGGAGLTVEQDVGTLKLTSITAYRESTYYGLFDADRLPAALLETNVNQDDKQFSQELQLASGTGSKLTWILGGYYLWGEGALVPVTVRSPGGLNTINSAQKVSSVAAFGQATYPLSDSTNATVGLRYTSELRSIELTQQTTTPAGVRLPAVPVANEKRYKRLTWRFALDHHFSDDLLGYLSYNRGFKSGGFNPQSTSGTPFDPEILDAYEAGMKLDLFDRKVRLNAALFYYDYKNIQTVAFISGLTSIFNATSAKIYGTDFDMTIAPTRNLTLNLGGSILHDRFNSFRNAVVSTPRPTGGNIQATGDATGNRLPATADWTVNASVNYTVPLPTGSLAMNVTYFHSDGWFTEVDNRNRQKPYDLVNASATWFLDSAERYSVRVWGKNLTDEVFAMQISTQPAADGIIVAPGRTYGVSLGVKF